MSTGRFMTALLMFTSALLLSTPSRAAVSPVPPPGTYQLQQDVYNLTGQPLNAQVLDFGGQPDVLRYFGSSRHGYYTLQPQGLATRLNLVFNTPLISLPSDNLVTLTVRTAGEALAINAWDWWNNGLAIPVPALSGSIRALPNGPGGQVDRLTWTMLNSTTQAFALNGIGFGASDNRPVTLQSRAVSSGAAPADQNPAGTVLLPPGGSVSYGLQLSLPYQPGTGPILAATGTLSYTGGAMPALVAPLASGAQFRFEHDVAAPGSVEVAGVGGAQLPTTGLGQIPVTGTGQIPAPSTGAASISGRYVLESGAPLKKVDVVLKQVDVSPNVEIAKVTTGDDGLFSFAVPALGHVYGLEAQPPQNIYPDVGAIPGVAGRYVDVYNLHVYTQPDITSYSGYVFVAAKIR